ncbi:dipeptidase [Emcibacter sp. SYSU 3D8]|uniref:dipeptidase n=1 Tax=Emcibacter sp. SYSU 3D8 TaxID=3133969 RepID=UPI0031FE9E1C
MEQATAVKKRHGERGGAARHLGHGRRGGTALRVAAALLWGQAILPVPALADDAADIHARILTIDTHIDIPGGYATPKHDPGVKGDLQVDLPKMAEGKLDAGFFIVYVGQGHESPVGYADAYKQAVAKFEAIHRQAEQYPDRIEMALSPDDVERIVRSGKLASCIGVENLYSAGPDISKIAEFHARGARYMSLTHSGDNHLADSANFRGKLDRPSMEIHGGLTGMGRAAIAEMNRLGVMVDVSHSSEATTLQAVEASRAPVIASHSALRGVHDIPRNLSDKALKALAAKGGVVQVVAFDSYLRAPRPEKAAALEALRKDLGLTTAAAWKAITDEQRNTYMARLRDLHAQYGRATVSDLADHIDHAVTLVGIEHVGIASDFGGGGGIGGWEDASETGNVTAELVRRGYSEADIGKLWSGNLLRVWRAAEAAAR